MENNKRMFFSILIIITTQFVLGQTVSWKKIQPPDNKYIDAWSLNKAGSVFIVSDSLFYISMNLGDNWSLYGKRADTSKVISIAVSDGGNIFYVTGSSYRYRSKDSAQNWDKYIPIGYYGPSVSSYYKSVDITRNGSLLLMQGDNLQNAWTANTTNDTVYQWTPLYFNGSGFARNILSYSSDKKRIYVGQQKVNTGHDIIDGGICGGGGSGYGFFQHDVSALYVNSKGDACSLVDGSTIYYTTSIESLIWTVRPLPPLSPPQSMVLNSHGDIFIYNGQLLYVSRLASPSWRLCSTGLPSENIVELKISENGYLFVKMASGELYRSEFSTTGINESPTITPKQFRLFQNFPNPFNPTTRIEFSLPTSSYTTLKIYDPLGREIHTLLSGNLEAGDHSTVWDAINYPSGVYYYRLQSESMNETRKLLLLK